MPNLHTLHPDRDYLQIRNEAIDELPDLASIGYLAVLLRHKDGWIPSTNDLVKNKPGLSKGAAAKARKTVMEYGYYVSVRYQHSYRKQFATDIWRSKEPHTDADLDQIASMYRPGSILQIPVVDKDKNAKRDARNRVIYRQVTVLWARVDSWRGEEVVGEAVESTEEADPNHPVDNSDPDPVDNSSHRGADFGYSVRPAETPVFPGPTEYPATEGSAGRGVGGSDVYKKTRKKTSQKTREENSPPSPRGSAASEVSGSRNVGEGEGSSKSEEAARRLLHELSRSVPEDLVDTLTYEQKVSLVSLVVQAFSVGVSAAEIRSQLANVTGTKVLGPAWTSKLQRLIDTAMEQIRRQEERRASLPACSTCRCEEGQPLTHRTVLQDPSDATSPEIPCPTCRGGQSPRETSFTGLAAS